MENLRNRVEALLRQDLEAGQVLRTIENKHLK